MQVVLRLRDGEAEVMWDTSFCDDRTQVNSILHDLAKVESNLPKYSVEEVLGRHLRKFQLDTDYECPTCAAYDAVGCSREEAHDSGQVDMFSSHTGD